MHHANINKEKIVVILISNKVDVRAKKKKITGDRKGHYIMLKG